MDKKNKQLLETNKKLLCQRLSTLGVTKAVFEYSGCGDSGQFDDISYEVHGKKATKGQTEQLDAELVEQVDFGHGFAPGTYATVLVENGRKTMSLNDAIERLGSEILSAMGIDWYNNEGGQGVGTIDVQAGVITISSEQNYMTTQDEEITL